MTYDDYIALDERARMEVRMAHLSAAVSTHRVYWGPEDLEADLDPNAFARAIELGASDKKNQDELGFKVTGFSEPTPFDVVKHGLRKASDRKKP